MTTPPQGPALAITDVANDATLSAAARTAAITIHNRALHGEPTTLVDLVGAPGVTPRIVPPWVSTTSLVSVLDELAAADLIDSDGWPATVMKP